MRASPAVAGGGAQGGDRQGRGDSAAREASRNRRSPRQEGRVHGTVLALFHREGEQGIERWYTFLGLLAEIKYKL